MNTSSLTGGPSLREDQLKQSLISSQGKASRITKKADRLTAKSKRLRDQADQLEQKAKRLRDSVTEEVGLQQSLNYEVLCLALSRNDSCTTAIEGSDTFPQGYAEPLGNALDKNTHVSSIEICLETSLPVYIYDNPYGVNRESHTDYIVRAKKYAEPLVKFLQSSKFLQRVKIHSSPGFSRRLPDGVGDCYVEACFQNPNVEEIGICYLDKITPRAIRHCLPQSSLKKLRIAFVYADDFTVQDRQAMVNVFSKLSSLSNLDLECCDFELLASILTCLQTHSPMLEELKLALDNREGAPRLWSTLSALLHSSSRMKHLALSSVRFDLQAMRSLVNGLKRPDDLLGTVTASSSTTVRELSLTDCRCEVEAQRLLVEFMQTRAAVDLLGEASSLQKLTIAGVESHYDWLSEELISMLCLQRNLGVRAPNAPAAEPDANHESCYYSTVGSQIESLSVCPFGGEYFDLFETMAKHAHLIRLQAIEVSTIDQDKDVTALADCISKIDSLRAVNIRDLSVSARPLLASLRTNGTIHSASIQCCVDKEITTKFSRTYTERNEHLDGLLRESSIRAVRDQSSDLHDDANRSGSKSKKSFAPTLWAAAQQVPRTEASKLLRSFLSLRDSVGHK